MIRTRALIIGLFAMVLLLIAAPASAQSLSISDAELDQASRQEAYQAESKYGVVTDAAVLARVEPVFQRVARSARTSRWPLQMKVLNDPSPNAFALPNGMLYVNRGLVDLPNLSDDELGFVLAHEISHVTLQHARKQVEREQLQATILTILTGGQEQWVQYLAQLVHTSVTSGYTRGFEAEADTEALETMVRAQLDPRAAMAFFERLAQLEADKGGVRIFPTHPLTSDRIKNTEKWLAAHSQIVAEVTASTVAEAGRLAPSFQGTTASGQLFKLSDYLGKERILLYFWDASVPMTVQALSSLDGLARSAGSDVRVVAVHSTPSAWAKAQAPRVLSRLHLGIPVVLDNGEAFQKFGIESVTPVVVIMDARGLARYRSVGVPSMDHLRGALAAVKDDKRTLWVEGAPPVADEDLARRNLSLLRVVQPGNDNTHYTVVVDGVARGTAPSTAELAAGQHVVMLRRPDSPSSTFLVTMIAGTRLNLIVPGEILLPGAHIGTP